MVAHEFEIDIPVEDRLLTGILSVPDHAETLVVSADGSGSSRFSPRSRTVADVLASAHIGTLLVDLLTADEADVDARTGVLQADVDLLATRVDGVTDWIVANELLRTMRLGYFGASTGAAAMLMAAARRPSSVGAVVSRGGRPDLAGSALEQVRAPTLLIVGGEDHDVIDLNEDAFARLSSPRKQLQVVPGATHLFEEPGALEQVAALARAWFDTFLGASAQADADAR